MSNCRHYIPYILLPYSLNNDGFTIQQFRAFDEENQLSLASSNVERIHSVPIKNLTPRDEVVLVSPTTNITKDGDIVITTGIQDQFVSDSEYHDAQECGSLIDQLAGLNRTPVEFSGTELVSSYVSPENELNSAQYDSFSKTLMLQHLLERNINQEHGDSSDSQMLRVIDPYSENLISVGGVVVVIKPFFGVEGYQFSCLQPGDLIRIVKFYIKDTETRPKQFKLGKLKKSLFDQEKPLPQSSHDDSEIDDKTAEFYGNIYCSGVLLNTYLEFSSNCLRLKVKDLSEFARKERELLKDFPLNCVSLETTLLTSV